MNDITNTLTLEDIQKNFPTKKGLITQEIVDIFNSAKTEPEFQGESLLQTAITYENVMTKNRAGMKEYLNAIRFCAYLISLDDNYTEAYKKTFYNRDFVKERISAPVGSIEYRELTSAASRYRRSKLVVDILTMSQVPLDLMFLGYRYKAINTLATEMTEAKYSRDRINAAKFLLEATKGADQIQLDIGVGTTDRSINLQEQLNNNLSQLIANQAALLDMGASIKDVQKIGINLNTIDVEVEEYE